MQIADFSDTQSLVPCKRCTELLQEGDRFCRYCGQPQLEADIEALPEGRALAPIALKPDLAYSGEDRPDWSSRSVSPSRLVIGITAGLVLVFAAVLLHDLYLERQDATAVAQPLPTQGIEQVQAALASGDLSAAQRGLEMLETDKPGDPAVQQLRESFDRQVQALVEERNRLQATSAAKEAATAPPEPAAAAPPAPQPPPPAPAEQAAAPQAEQPSEAAAPPAAQAPAPPPQAPTAEAARGDCNQALAALGLCTAR